MLAQDPQHHAQLDALSDQYTVPVNQAPLISEEAAMQVWNTIATTISVSKQTQPAAGPEATTIESHTTIPPAITGRRLALHRWSAAAAIIILLGGAAYWWMQHNPRSSAVTSNDKTQPVILPGGNKATLRLADGSAITLDSVSNGNIAMQGNVAIVKQANGQISYQLKNTAAGAVMINTMSTPKGGQYQLSLPDGTKVWLNAASAITYPTAFTGSQRKVSITGEVYFEVTKNKEKPFIVDVAGRSTVEVLGTHFNINSYADEDYIKTTLLEGSVKVAAGNNRQGVVLKPGQQAKITQAVVQSALQQPEVINHPDIEQAMAWKNGSFQFSQLSLAEAMRQLERWYDIEVVYEKNIPNIKFWGGMKRDLNVSQVVEALGEMGVRCRVEGKKLIVMP